MPIAASAADSGSLHSRQSTGKSLRHGRSDFWARPFAPILRTPRQSGQPRPHRLGTTKLASPQDLEQNTTSVWVSVVWGVERSRRCVALRHAADKMAWCATSPMGVADARTTVGGRFRGGGDPATGIGYVLGSAPCGVYTRSITGSCVAGPELRARSLAMLRFCPAANSTLVGDDVPGLLEADSGR